MGVLLERQPEREAAVTETTLLERMAGIVALLAMALVVLAGAAWQARRPSSLCPHRRNWPRCDAYHSERMNAMQIETPPTEKRYEKPEGERRGLVIVNTGDGKGKSTAAFGLALRAHGRGKAVKIFQFMKVPTARFGEHRMFEQIGLPIEGLGDGFSWKSRTWSTRPAGARRLGEGACRHPVG
jgi:cob(I)yrinic acid a,c-diamide adenosyltransferase (EC 2.5.1.17)